MKGGGGGGVKRAWENGRQEMAEEREEVNPLTFSITNETFTVPVLYDSNRINLKA